MGVSMFLARGNLANIGSFGAVDERLHKTAKRLSLPFGALCDISGGTLVMHFLRVARSSLWVVHPTCGQLSS